MWITNDEVAANALRRADHAFETARELARNLPLDEKIIALREARTARQAAYAFVAGMQSK